MHLRSLLAFFALLSTALLARADTYTVFDLNSTFVFPGQPAGTISGTITMDDDSGQFTAADLTASGIPSGNGAIDTIESGTNGTYFGTIGIFLLSDTGFELKLYLTVPTTADYTGSDICSTTSPCNINVISSYERNTPPPLLSEFLVAESGTLEPETIAPTPEPASGLLLATGLLGLALLPGRLGWRSFRFSVQ